MRDYYEQLYVNRMDKFLKKVQSPKIDPGRNIKYEQTNHKH